MITKEYMISALSALGVKVSDINEFKAERITHFEVTPAKGFKTSLLEYLDEDLAFNLKINPFRVRIFVPIGIRKIVIEIPNEVQKYIPFLPLLESEEFRSNSYELPIVLGKAVDGTVVTFDLCALEHLLIAGATGQGKTECLHTIITSLICSHRNVQLVLSDPKKVEFDHYERLPKSFFFASDNKDTPIIRHLEDAEQTLQAINDEIDRRYDLLKAAGVRNICKYNELMDVDERRLPYIVSVIDEYGDYVMELGDKVMSQLCRIAQIGRLVGIHSKFPLKDHRTILFQVQ